MCFFMGFAHDCRDTPQNHISSFYSNFVALGNMYSAFYVASALWCLHTVQIERSILVKDKYIKANDNNKM